MTYDLPALSVAFQPSLAGLDFTVVLYPAFRQAPMPGYFQPLPSARVAVHSCLTRGPEQQKTRANRGL